MKKKQSILDDLVDGLLEIVFAIVSLIIGAYVFVAFDIDIDIAAPDGELLMGVGAMIILIVVFACLGCIRLISRLREKRKNNVEAETSPIDDINKSGDDYDDPKQY